MLSGFTAFEKALLSLTDYVKSAYFFVLNG